VGGGQDAARKVERWLTPRKKCDVGKAEIRGLLTLEKHQCKEGVGKGKPQVVQRGSDKSIGGLNELKFKTG